MKKDDQKMKFKNSQLTKAEFARVLGLKSMVKVTKAVEKGEIVQTSEGLIDVNDDTNLAFVVNFNSNNRNKTNPVTLNPAVATKTEAEIQRILKQTEKIALSVEKEAGRLIERTLVDSFFGKLTRVIWNNYFPIGEQCSTIISAEFGLLDDNARIRIRDIIDREVQAAASEFKRAVEEIIEKEI